MNERKSLASVEERPNAPDAGAFERDAAGEAHCERGEEGLPTYVVGIGASAGGLEALRSFFSSMPADTGMSFVVIQHLAPDYKSLMVELLARLTKMPILRAEEGMVVEANKVYLIPPRYNLTIAGNTLHLSSPPPGRVLNLPIDIFFRSLAQECGEQAVAVVLSGTGSDGARGIRAVKEAGGMIMVQAEASAKFAGMPSSAIATGTADFVLPVEEMPQQLVNFAKHPFAARPAQSVQHIPEDSSQLDRICARVREVTSINFENYKTATLVRRIERRMSVAQIQEINDYLQYVMQSRQEAEALGKDLLIGVTKFYRDGESFQVLENILPSIFEQAGRRTLRVWSAACSTGEEAYTLAMLCDRVRDQRYPRADLKVFATDVDRSALEIAGAGVYPRSVVADLPMELVDRFFIPEGTDHQRIVRTLRDRLIFARQDLLNDPPFTKIDLVSCRNLLIYLRPPAQRKLLSLLHFALQPGGLLFLGSSESLGELSYAFETVDSKHRIFRKIGGVTLRVSDSVSSLRETATWSSGIEERLTLASRLRRSSGNAADAVQRHLLERFAPATIVCSPQFELVYSLGPVTPYLHVATGPARLDVLKMLPRDLSLAVSTAAAQSLRENRVVEYRSVRFHTADGADETLCVSVEPFESGSDEGKLLLITIEPDAAADFNPAGVENFDFDRKLMDRATELERELQSTRENLQASIEQQETANEELQAANEELLAANEELQSTNEELESVNEELYTVNAEYQNKIHELTELNDDMENFTRSTEIGTVFLDADLRLRRFTPAFGRIAGLMEADVGRSATAFSHPALAAIVQAGPSVLKGSETHEQVLALGEMGDFLLRLQPYRRDQSGFSGLVASLVNITRILDIEKELEAILQTVSVGICVTNKTGHFVQVNSAYCELYGYKKEELIGQHFSIVVPEGNRETASRMHDDFIEGGMEIPAVWDVVDKAGSVHKVAVRASLLERGNKERLKITVVTDLEKERELFPVLEAITTRVGSN